MQDVQGKVVSTGSVSQTVDYTKKPAALFHEAMHYNITLNYSAMENQNT